MESIELVYRDGRTETFDSVSRIEAGFEELFPPDPETKAREPGRKFTAFAMPKSLDEFPEVVYLTKRPRDIAARVIQDVREIRAL